MADWSGRTFGLELRGSFTAPGLEREGGGGESRSVAPTRVKLATEVATPGGAVVLLDQPLPGGRFAISRDPEAGYVLEHSFYGDFRVNGDGSEVVCAPRAAPDWVWQRFLVAQPLPLASLLRGHEVLHASVVAVDERAVLVMGASGAGKTSVALHLAARGGRFMADDVAALELRDGVVRAHPGPPLASVDEAELERLPAAASAGWRRLGVLEGEARIALPQAETAAVPVGAVYLLRRVEEGSAPAVVPRTGSAAVLLGGTFNAYVHERARLERQIEVTGWLADHVSLCEVTIPPSATAAMVADAVLGSASGAPQTTSVRS